jgi:hypothetical protein
LNVKITERDKKLFDFLFKFRYAKKEQIIDYLGFTQSSFYQRTKLLQNAGYLESSYIYEHRFCPKVYFNSVKIRKEHEIKAYQKKPKINLRLLDHHLKIIDVFNILVKSGVDENRIFSEREIILNEIGVIRNRRKYKNRNVLPPVIPDLVLAIQVGNRSRFSYVALEVELSRKNKDLMDKVFSNYDRWTTYYGVEYLCSTDSLKSDINKRTYNNYIKAYTLDEFYSNTIFTFGLTPSLTYS